MDNDRGSPNARAAGRVRYSSVVAVIAAIALLVLLLAARGAWLEPRVWLRTYAVTALVTLVAAAVSFWQVSHATGGGTAASAAWRVLFAGMAIFLLGHAHLTYQRFVSPTADTAFPSLADVFFVVGQTLLIAGLVIHLIAYLRTGLPVGHRLSYVLMYVIVAVVVAYLTAKLNLPMWDDVTRTFGWKMVNTVYHVIDMLTLCVALALLRMALLFRGGALAQGWAAIAVGFVFMMVADLTFGIGVPAEYSALGYFASYASITYGVVRHREVILSVR
ncbi:MAG: hypothetical protein AB1714_00525 [Acidobacteriota bacterium]